MRLPVRSPLLTTYRGRSLRRWALPELTLSEDLFDAGLRLEPHTHDRASLVVVLDGGYVETAGRRAYEVGRGGVLFQPAAAPHADEFGVRGARCFRVELAASWAERRGLADGASAPFHLRGGPEAAAAAVVYRELRRPDDLSPLAVESALAGLLVSATRRRSAGGTRPPGRPSWLTQVLATLHDRLREPPSLAELGVVAGAHPGHVARAFRRHVGQSVGAYVREARVALARERLARTAEPLARIAAAAGFCDESHLARVFRRAVGVSPGAYRRGLGRDADPDRAVESPPGDAARGHQWSD